jgi:hypothetical protein
MINSIKRSIKNVRRNFEALLNELKLFELTSLKSLQYDDLRWSQDLSHPATELISKLNDILQFTTNLYKKLNC